MSNSRLPFFLGILNLLVLSAILPVESRCPISCTCDSINGQKRVRCDTSDSLDDIDADIDILEISPQQNGRSNVYGPAIPAVFDRFRRLRTLVIKNNGIRSIPTSTARQLAQLTSLDLTENSIVNLADLSLSTFRGLNVLNLAQNQISEIPADAFKSLSNLQALSLTDNSITRILPRTFLSQKNSLRVLDLRNNELRQLPDDFFNSIDRVERLDLRGNQLMILPRGLLRMSSLRFLLLDNNQLSTVPREFVQAWQNDDQLSDVTLYGNPLHCDEGLESLVNLVKSTQGRNQVCVVVGRTGDKSKSGTCPVCDSPSSLQGRPIDAVTAGDLGSAPPASDVSFSNQLVNGRPPVSPTRDVGGARDGGPVTFSVTSGAGSNARRDTVRGGSIGTLNSPSRGSIPAGAQCSSTTCYVFSAVGQKKWDDAEAACKAFGWKLAEITSATEQRKIVSFLHDAMREDSKRNSVTRGWWIGARLDPKFKTFTLPSSGRNLPYSNWGSGQPTGFAEAQDCVEMWDNGQWGTLKCQSTANNMYICQFPAPTR